MSLPSLIRVRQRLPDDHIANVPDAVRQELRAAGLAGRLPAGGRVAITAGSRGIAHIAAILRKVVDEVLLCGASPFIVPAMGSHGGATAEGQVALLADYGITAESMGCPILSDMSVVELDRTESGVPVYMDRHAFAADAVVLVGRVKPHTAFRAPVESGLCKMLAVGLGKQLGAEALHQVGLGAAVEEAAKVALATGRVALGLALVENAYERTCLVEAVPPERIVQRDRELLLMASGLLPRIAFDPLDALVVDWMGKNLSGSGMDFNVIGLWRRIEGVERRPFFRHVVALNLTPESHGNAMGIGAADFTTRKLFDAIDLSKTYMNALTASAPAMAKIPIILANDREAIETAIRSANPPGEPRVARISSTLHLSEYRISPALLDEARRMPGLEITGEPEPMQFDADGNLVD